MVMLLAQAYAQQPGAYRKKPARVIKPFKVDTTVLKGGFAPLEPSTPSNPEGPAVGCAICPTQSEIENLPVAHWRLNDNNTAFLCSENSYLSFGFNAAHGTGQGVIGSEALPYRYTFNLSDRTQGGFESIGILSSPNNSVALPPGTPNCRGLLLSPYWGITTNGNNPLTLGTRSGENVAVTIFDNGNVGIGTGGEAPTQKLGVNGSLYASGDIQTDGTLQVAGTANVGGTLTTGSISTSAITVNSGSANVNKIWKTNGSGQTEWVEPDNVFDVTGTGNYVAKFNPGGTGLDNSDIFNTGGKVRIGGTTTPEFSLEVNTPETETKILRVGKSLNYMKFSTNTGSIPNWNYLDFGNQQQDGSSITAFRNFYQSGVPQTFLQTDGGGEVSLGFGRGLRVFNSGRVRIGFSSEVGDLYNSTLHTMGSIRIGKANASTEDDNRLIFSGGLSTGGDGENNCGIWFQRRNLGPSKSALQLHFGGMIDPNPDNVSRLEIGHHTANGLTKNIILHASGEIYARKVKVTLDNLNDIVFLPDYKLRTLKETEAYIKANGHLPEVPSQAEVAKDGMDVGEMNNILLKKIEEMTLHLIRMEKEIEALKNQK